MVAKQQQDMVGVKVDVERYVENAIATITSNTQASQGPGEQKAKDNAVATADVGSSTTRGSAKSTPSRTT